MIQCFPILVPVFITVPAINTDPSPISTLLPIIALGCIAVYHFKFGYFSKISFIHSIFFNASTGITPRYNNRAVD